MKSRSNTSQKEKSLFLFGNHPVSAALQNPSREIIEILLTRESGHAIPVPAHIPIRYVRKEELDELVGVDRVHQGIVARCRPLKPRSIEDVLCQADRASKAVVILLDQVTDPHNVGAILRSALAFDALAVIMPEAGAPDETGVLAKSASGALDLISLIKVPNLARAMEKLKQNGFWCIGMDGNAPKTLSEEKLPTKCAFVMGSEGTGLRQLTQKNCDYMTKLPINPIIDSLNVSVATALTLYEWNRQHKAR